MMHQSGPLMVQSEVYGKPSVDLRDSEGLVLKSLELATNERQDRNNNTDNKDKNSNSIETANEQPLIGHEEDEENQFGSLENRPGEPASEHLLGPAARTLDETSALRRIHRLIEQDHEDNEEDEEDDQDPDEEYDQEQPEASGRDEKRKSCPPDDRLRLTMANSSGGNKQAAMTPAAGANNASAGQPPGRPHEAAKPDEGQQQVTSVGGPNEQSSCCAGCRTPIRDKFLSSVIDLHWHQDCVQCCECSLKLIDKCYTFEGRLYCRHDFLLRFGPKCFGCHEPIEPMEFVQRIKGNRVYHLKCFTCCRCQRQLETGEQVHFIDEQRLVCRQDFQRLSAQQQAAPRPALVGQQEAANRLAGGQVSFQQQQAAGYLTLLGSGSRQARLRPESAKLGGEADGAEAVPTSESEPLAEQADELVAESGAGERGRAAALAYLGQRAEQVRRNSNNLENDAPAAGSLQAPARQAQLQSRRKRRRKQRQQQLAGSGSARRLAGRNGESILDAGAASILAPGGATDQAAAAKPDAHSSSLSTLSSLSTASNCSSASSASSSSSLASNSSASSTSVSLQAAGGAAHAAPAAGPPAGQQHQQQQLAQHQHQHQSAGSQAGAGAHKPTRVRTVLNEKQLQTLRDCYAHNPRPDALMKEQLVDLTGLSPRVIRVWFQNKRCKDKKKSILHKQMQQHEKDGRHLAGLGLMRGVHLTAASPVAFQEPAGAEPSPGASPGAPHYAIPSAGSPQPLEIRAYEPPWKSLAEYAQAAGAPTDAPLDAASPSYQQLIGQVHGFQAPANEQQIELRQPNPPGRFAASPAAAPTGQPAPASAPPNYQHHAAPGGQPQLHLHPQQLGHSLGQRQHPQHLAAASQFRRH